MTAVVTYATGGTTKPVGALYVQPNRQVVDPGSAQLADAGVDAAFIADLLSACLAHERCGAQLYRSVGHRTADSELRSQYRHFGTETERHVAILEEVIATGGGDPQYVSPSARATEKAGAGLLECTFLLNGSVDPATSELVMLEAVMLAEAKDDANWELLAELVAAMPAGDMRDRLEAACTEVLAQEHEHYGWAHDTRRRMLYTLATGASPPDALRRVRRSGGSTSATNDIKSMSRDELYATAQQLGIPGRSAMTKSQLQDAITQEESR